MEIHKALEEVENALTALKIKDRFGEYCEGLEVIGLVAFQGGDDYEKLVDDFGSGTITPVEYRDRMIGFIEATRIGIFTAKVDSQLNKLGKTQKII